MTKEWQNIEETDELYDLTLEDLCNCASKFDRIFKVEKVLNSFEEAK